MSYRHLRIVDVHTHFPIENTMGLPPVPEQQHPLLLAYARDRGRRMAMEWNTEPTEPAAKTDAEVDANIVMRAPSDLVEVQGTGEQGVFSRAELDRMLDLAEAGLAELFAAQRKALGW